LSISNPFCLRGNGNQVRIRHGKAAKATVAIAASYGLGQASDSTKYPQLTFANAIALIIIIAILYGPHLVPIVK
jgi:hypothetical protein